MAQESSKLEQEEGTPCTTPEAPSLCSNNCGFFGSSATMNLCSSCYRDLILLKSKASTPAPVLEKKPLPGPKEVQASSPSSSTSPTSACANPSPCSNKEALPCGDSKEKAQPLRCFACHKKVGMRGFKCRCGDIFCSLHRYSDKHTCSFDYKAAARASITKANPIVQAQKLEKI